MSENAEKTPRDKRRKRVNAIKRFIIVSILICLFLPYVFAGVCYKYIVQSNKNIDNLTKAFNELQARVEEIKTVEEEEEPVVTIVPEPIIEAPEAVSTEVKTDNVTLEASFSLKEEYEGKKKVYLTFDDGPSAYTETILDILEQYDIKATFFVVGKNDEAAADRIKLIHEKGHTVGMHSYSHVYRNIYSSEDAFVADFNTIYDYITEITGEEPFAYRFPGGSSNAVSILDVKRFALLLKEREITFFDWNVHSGDGETGNLSKETIRDNVLNGVKRHEESIVLMHDAVSRKSTVDALPMIIESLLEDGDYVFLPITRETVPIQHRDFFDNE